MVVTKLSGLGLPARALSETMANADRDIPYSYVGVFQLGEMDRRWLASGFSLPGPDTLLVFAIQHATLDLVFRRLILKGI